MDKTYLDELTEILQNDERLVNNDGKLLKTKITELAQQLDPELIKLILKNKKLKDFFFKKVDDVLIFNQEKFLTFVHNEAFLADSYTAFKNKIGLASSKDDYISERDMVVLNWPYKDCVLEGGQDKEDQKRDEVFWNETLGADQKDVLLAPKVLTGFKKYDKDGEHEVKQLSNSDNFILRGNNLLALHTLKKRFSGKVKLIYIDPPFNTGSDGFNYNDRFNRSTWLTFMRNRLVAAKSLLSDDGSILVHLDFNESHYAKVLMDEIFGEDQFKNNIVWCYTGPSGSSNFLPRKHDDILYYGRSSSSSINMPYIEHKSGVHNTGQVFGSTESKESFKEEVEAKGKKLEDWWIDIYSTDRYRSETLGFSGQKPEKLMQRIIDMTTSPGDIVLDYHLGSGTTAATAHKMGRRYIGIEQLNYGENDPINRLKDVIEGDKSGISDDVSWSGGGSFVYAHLKNDVNKFIRSVESAKNSAELLELLKTVLASNFLSHRVDPDKFERENYRKLPIIEQKRLLIDLVNKNKLYVNYHDIDDSDYKIDTNTKKLNKWMQSRD